MTTDKNSGTAAAVNRAKQMLSKGNVSIKEAALACGFNDLGYFSRSFKKEFGYTPSQFTGMSEQINQEE